MNIHYWRTTDKAEVDFVITGGSNIIPVEVKYTRLKTNQLSRSFLSFISKYQPEKAFVVNLSYQNSRQIESTEITFISFYNLFSISF